MEREGVNCPEHPHELLPHQQLKRHTDSFAREIIEGTRQLTIDLLAIPLDSQPGRKTAVRLFTRVENRVRELRGESTKAPFYPYDSYYLLTYLDHISIWQPRIEQDAETWLSEWDPRKALWCESLADELLATPYFRKSKFGPLGKEEAIKMVRKDPSCRRFMNEVLLKSYADFVMNVPDVSYGTHSMSDNPTRNTAKTCLIEEVKNVASQGVNPFDVLYGMGNSTFQSEKNRYNRMFLVLFIGLALIRLYACASGMDI